MIISEFQGSYWFLSNFFRTPVNWQWITYPTSEHAFNAGKTTNRELREWIAEAENPREAKNRGRAVRLRPNWDELVRYEVMADVLRAKFSNPGLQSRLLATGDATLVEGNWWHDQHWGDCGCATHYNQPGQNHLGRLLMELRQGLRD